MRTAQNEFTQVLQQAAIRVAEDNIDIDDGHAEVQAINTGHAEPPPNIDVKAIGATAVPC